MPCSDSGREKAIALGVVGTTALDRSGEAWDQHRIHLAIAIDLDHDVHTLVECRLIAGAYGAAYALVLFVEDHPHARVVALLAHQFATAIGALVVNHVDALHLRRHARDHVEHMVLYLVAGNGDGDLHGLTRACPWMPA